MSLCQSFPTLFDLVDNSPTMEVDGVAKEDYAKVVDQCYLCDLCYMTKCPYVPPHPWNVDFPHLMLRAKAAKFRKEGARLRDRVLTSTDRVGRLATIPVVAQIVNKASTTPAVRKVMDRTMGISSAAPLPTYDSARFRETAGASLAFPVRDGARTPGKVAIFATCYVNYVEPGIGHDLLAILAHNEVPYTLVEKEVCCGMPKLELGDLESVEKLKNVNIPALAALARAGHAILTCVPSCTLMFKTELPLIFPGDDDVESRLRRDVRSVRIPRAARQGRAAAQGLPDAARQGELPRPVPFARAEHRAEDARSARMDPRDDAQHGRALRGTRRNVRGEARVLREFDEDRHARVQADGGARSGLRHVRLPDRRPADPARASINRAPAPQRATSIR